MNNIKIPFKGWDLIAWVNQQDGQARIAVKPICEAIGISWGSQRDKLMSDDRFNCTDISMVAEDGKLRDMLTLPVDQINGWLFGISPKKVKSEIEPNLRDFQKYCFRVLYEATSGEANGEVVALLKQHIEILTEQLRVAHARIDAYEGRLSALEEAHEALQGSVVSGAARTLRQGHMRLVKSA